MPYSSDETAAHWRSEVFDLLQQVLRQQTDLAQAQAELATGQTKLTQDYGGILGLLRGQGESTGLMGRVEVLEKGHQGLMERVKELDGRRGEERGDEKRTRHLIAIALIGPLLAIVGGLIAVLWGKH